MERYDHHCPWINNCVGVRNHNLFLSLILLLAVQFSVGIYVSLVALTTFIQYSSECGDFSFVDIDELCCGDDYFIIVVFKAIFAGASGILQALGFLLVMYEYGSIRYYIECWFTYISEITAPG